MDYELRGHVGKVTWNASKTREGISWQVGTLARDACAAREGTSGQGDMGTRGEAKIHGRHAVPPLPATESSSYRFAGCGIILI